MCITWDSGENFIYRPPCAVEDVLHIRGPTVRDPEGPEAEWASLKRWMTWAHPATTSILGKKLGQQATSKRYKRTAVPHHQQQQAHSLVAHQRDGPVGYPDSGSAGRRSSWNNDESDRRKVACMVEPLTPPLTPAGDQHAARMAVAVPRVIM